MIIDSSFMQLLEATEARFRDRRQVRADHQQLVGSGRVAEANPEELVACRIARLGGGGGPGRTAPTLQRGLERVMGFNDLMSIRFLEDGLRKSMAVARIRIAAADGTVRGYGTGFLVSPRLLLTNQHVLPTLEVAAGSQAEFNYQLRIDGTLRPSQTFALEPGRFFLADQGLDYALVAVRPDAGLAAFGWLPLIEEQGKVLVGEWVNIVQHPNGEPKQLAIRENRVIDELDLFLHYLTDTAPGSSGSPVFNDQWEVVALHHSGVPKRTAGGQILSIDARPWEPWMGEHRIAWVGNEGIRASRLVAHIRSQAEADPRLQPLVHELLEARAPAPDPDGTPLPSVVPPPVSRPLPPELVVPPGGSRWTIPLTLSLTLGEMPGPVEPAALRQALIDLAEAARRPYFDARADQEAAETYYAGIAADGSSGDRFESLSALLRSSHTRTVSYRPAEHLYPWVDLHPDLRLRSIYSGQEFDPAALIREDFRIDQERSHQLEAFLGRETAGLHPLTARQITEQREGLEAALPYNCEHVVPQSWFNRREPMRGDLHHLFTCERRCNSFRSNIPYDEFPDFNEAVLDPCGKRVDNRFEPLRGKGPVARAVLYILLRYPGLVGDQAGEMPAARLPTLLAWHRDHPAELYEKHRNAAIFALQGNRNPLIDQPDWADRIAFQRGMG